MTKSEAKRKSDATWRLRNRERIAKRNRDYYAENADRISTRSQNYYQVNGERVKERVREYYLNHKEYCLQQCRMREARLADLVPNPRSGPWSGAEDQIALRSDILTTEKAVMLQRSYKAVQVRIYKLRRSQPSQCLWCGRDFLSLPLNRPREGRERTVFCSTSCASSNTQARLRTVSA